MSLQLQGINGRNFNLDRLLVTSDQPQMPAWEEEDSAFFFAPDDWDEQCEDDDTLATEFDLVATVDQGDSYGMFNADDITDEQLQDVVEVVSLETGRKMSLLGWFNRFYKRD